MVCVIHLTYFLFLVQTVSTNRVETKEEIEKLEKFKRDAGEGKHAQRLNAVVTDSYLLNLVRKVGFHRRMGKYCKLGGIPLLYL